MNVPGVVAIRRWVLSAWEPTLIESRTPSVLSALGERRTLVERELQTLAPIAEGKPYGVIAEHLHVSYKTVANTCTQLEAKLGVRTSPELMRIAIQHLPAAASRSPK